MSQPAAYVQYLAGLVAQPADEWEGFYLTPAEGMNFGLRFQLAFPVYALYAIAKTEPSLADQCTATIARYVERMMHPRTWAYWLHGALASHKHSAEKPPQNKPNLVQGAVEMVHSKLGLAGGPIPLDPCQQGNIQYSGHLASMLGFYQLLSSDDRYNRDGFTLKAEVDGTTYAFEYSYSSLVEHIRDQMANNHFGGVCCEPGRAYAACNNHACISNVLHDRLYGTNFAATNAGWADWVEHKMLTSSGLLPLPAPNGLLSVAYMSELKMPIPVSFNFTDAWGLAFMAAWKPALVEKAYPRFRKRLKSVGAGRLKLSSMGVNDGMEISTESLNTAFALVLARDRADTATATALQSYINTTYQPLQDAAGRRYTQAKPVPYVTALVALSDTLQETTLHNLITTS